MRINPPLRLELNRKIPTNREYHATYFLIAGDSLGTFSEITFSIRRYTSLVQPYFPISRLHSLRFHRRGKQDDIGDAHVSQSCTADQRQIEFASDDVDASSCDLCSSWPPIKPMKNVRFALYETISYHFPGAVPAPLFLGIPPRYRKFTEYSPKIIHRSRLRAVLRQQSNNNSSRRA